jgi:isopentenyl-diphosphate delta-isomerase
MARIGMQAAWRPVAERYEELASSGHKIEFFALDLERADIARAKVYFRHGPVTVKELDTVASLARTHDSKRALRAYRACYKHEQLIANEPITCLSFRLGSDCPDEANVYLRLKMNDGSDPIIEILRAERVDPSSYLALRGVNQPHTSIKYELLSFRTLAPQNPAEIGLYLRFPQYKTVKTSAVEKDVVVLCSPEGTAVGTLPKSKVHHYATPLHLAFSSYLFDQDGNLLVTRRALTKSTWPGVITNSCCGHPSPNEPFAAAIERRIKHELGLSATNIKLVLPAFAYRAEMANGIVENELCPVFTAVVNPAELAFNPDEVDSTEWVPWPSFTADVLSGAREVSPWCKLQVAQLVSLGSNPLAWSAATGSLPSTALPSR